LLENNENRTNDCNYLGKKVETYNRYLKPREKTDGSFFGKLEHVNASMYIWQI
jgi:hypothetical protein